MPLALVLTLLADQAPAEASWWQIAPALVLGVAAIAVGLLLCRKGPS